MFHFKSQTGFTEIAKLDNDKLAHQEYDPTSPYNGAKVFFIKTTGIYTYSERG